VEKINQGKYVEFSWDTDVVIGDQVSLQVEGEGEKRTGKNDGKATFYFSSDTSKSVSIVVRGSSSGEDTGSIEVE
jgi:hypothetical protein